LGVGRRRAIAVSVTSRINRVLYMSSCRTRTIRHSEEALNNAKTVFGTLLKKVLPAGMAFPCESGFVPPGKAEEKQEAEDPQVHFCGTLAVFS